MASIVFVCFEVGVVIAAISIVFGVLMCFAKRCVVSRLFVICSSETSFSLLLSEFSSSSSVVFPLA